MRALICLIYIVELKFRAVSAHWYTASALFYNSDSNYGVKSPRDWSSFPDDEYAFHIVLISILELKLRAVGTHFQTVHVLSYKSYSNFRSKSVRDW